MRRCRFDCYHYRNEGFCKKGVLDGVFRVDEGGAAGAAPPSLSFLMIFLKKVLSGKNGLPIIFHFIGAYRFCCYYVIIKKSSLYLRDIIAILLE